MNYSLTYDEEVSKQANLKGYEEPAITSYQARKYPLDACYDGQPWQYNQARYMSQEMAEHKRDSRLEKKLMKKPR